MMQPTAEQLRWARARRMPFGKYAGRTLGDIEAEDVKYLDWLNGLSDIRDNKLVESVALLCVENAARIDAEVLDD